MITELIIAKHEIEKVNYQAIFEIQNKVNDFTDIMDMDESIYLMEKIGAI